MASNQIIYTNSDEAPALATRSLLPIVQAFASTANVEVVTKDISLAGRILARLGDQTSPNVRSDDLDELGKLVLTPAANIIKLPNISASTSQILECVEELKQAGFDIPDYPADPTTEDERATRQRYDSVKGSAVNPVLRQGNSDRRAPKAVKQYAKQNPHTMGAWDASSTTQVATMGKGDFLSNEQSTTIIDPTEIKVELVGHEGTTQLLVKPTPVASGDIIDATVLQTQSLKDFFTEQLNHAETSGALVSLHLKATMMKVSDPIIFGHFLKIFFSPVFEEFGDELGSINTSPNLGLASLLDNLDTIDSPTAEAISDAFKARIATGPRLAMVDSDKGITNLHVPSDVIIDASMAAMIRSSGHMWDSEGNEQDTLAIIPDSSYASLYSETIEFCKEYGAFDPTTMGTVPNIGLMAQRAEEYGSHDTTFEIPFSGNVVVTSADGSALFEHEVTDGDIWRMCKTKREPIENWIDLAISRSEKTNVPAVFWLDQDRPHDRELIKQVAPAIASSKAAKNSISILNVRDATRLTLQRTREGKDTISVTGNVLRDYLTDLFPILELGTSAKMLSVVPLMAGGGLFETGAGGSAPKHVQQFADENHLRWDSLGEFLALSESLRHLAETDSNGAANILAETLSRATERLLLENKNPKRKVPELDNRGSHYYLASFWAQQLAEQVEDQRLSNTFKPIAAKLLSNESQILEELASVQGSPVNLGGYYLPDDSSANSAMRPSKTFNTIIGEL